MRLKRSILAPVGVLGIAIATGGWFLQQGVDPEQNVFFQQRLFQEVVDRISNDYVEEVEKGSLYQSAIEGLIQELGDPKQLVPAEGRVREPAHPHTGRLRRGGGSRSRSATTT